MLWNFSQRSKGRYEWTGVLLERPSVREHGIWRIFVLASLQERNSSVTAQDCRQRVMRGTVMTHQQKVVSSNCVTLRKARIFNMLDVSWGVLAPFPKFSHSPRWHWEELQPPIQNEWETEWEAVSQCSNRFPPKIQSFSEKALRRNSTWGESVFEQHDVPTESVTLRRLELSTPRIEEGWNILFHASVERQCSWNWPSGKTKVNGCGTCTLPK